MAGRIRGVTTSPSITSRPLCPELRGVVGGPFEEGPWRSPCEFRKRGCHKRRLTDGGSPSGEQHIHQGPRTQDPEQLRPRLVWRHLFNAQRPPHPPSDGVHLLRL